MNKRKKSGGKVPTDQDVKKFNVWFDSHLKNLGQDFEEKKTEEDDRQSVEKISKEKVLKDLTLINAWNAISTNNKLDANKITHEKLSEIAKALKDTQIHTLNYETDMYLIPDGEFDELIKKIKQPICTDIGTQSGLTQQRIEDHKKERTAFKAKNSKIYSPTLSKSWKKYTTWGGIKTRKYKKGKKGRNGKTRNYKKRKTKKCKSKKRYYK
jgi:hypothetical protein